MTTRRLSLSYEELSRAGRDELKRLVEADLLDDPTRTRCVHLAKFFRESKPNGGLGRSHHDGGRRSIGRGFTENLAGNGDEGTSPLALGNVL